MMVHKTSSKENRKLLDMLLREKLEVVDATAVFVLHGIRFNNEDRQEVVDALDSQIEHVQKGSKSKRY
jgi:hypothetical protein